MSAKAVESELLASLKEFVAMYDGVRDLIGPIVKEKLARAELVIAKAERGQP